MNPYLMSWVIHDDTSSQMMAFSRSNLEFGNLQVSEGGVRVRLESCLKLSVFETFRDIIGLINKCDRTKRPRFLDYSWRELTGEVGVDSGLEIKASDSPAEIFETIFG